MRWLALLACLFLGCATTPPPPPTGPTPGPAASPPAEPAAAPEASPAPERDPSQPPPEVEAGCLPNCAMVHGKCQALVDPGPAFDGDEQTDEIGPGAKPAEELVKPCAPHCCRGQVD